MAGVGEAAAIVGLISTAASLSKAVIDVASKYKVARLHIESFGQEVGNLGNILGQMHRLYSKDDLRPDGGVVFVTVDILDQCSGLFVELETYRDALYSRTGSLRDVTFLRKTKWVFEEKKKLEYLRTRVESMKMDMLLTMTMSNAGGTVENPEQAPILSTQSEGHEKRSQPLKNDVVIPTSTDANPVINRASIDTTASVRSIMDSILSLYGHESLYERLSEYLGEALETGSMQVDQVRVPRITEDHMRKSTVVDHDGPDSRLILPCASNYTLDSSTANDNEAIDDIELENFDHFAATESGIPTKSYAFNPSQLQYDGERVASGFRSGHTRPVTLRQSYSHVIELRQSYAVVLSIFGDGKDWHYTLYTFLSAVKIWLRRFKPSMKIMWQVRMKFASTFRSKI